MADLATSPTPRMSDGYGQDTVELDAGDVNIGNVDVLTVAAGETHLGEVGGRLVRVSDEFTRPADTNAYAAKDVVADSTSAATIRTFAAAARIDAGSGYIVKATLLSSVAAEVQRMRLHLYNTSSPTVLNDNVANTVLYADRAKYVGFIDFPALTTETGASVAQALAVDASSKLPLAFTTVTTDDLYGVLETLDVYTPTSAATYAISLVVDQN